MKKKTLMILIILVTIMNAILPVANAAQAISKADLKKGKSIKTHLQFKHQDGTYHHIQCNYIYYENEGESHPAYCIKHGVDGVDEAGPYTVTINDLLKDKLIYNTILNGYPYKTPSQLGLDTADEAYVATKHAINSVLLDRNVMSFYHPIDFKGEKIRKAIYDIAEAGKQGNAVNKEATISITKVGNLTEKDQYYYQEYSVSADVNISEYSIKSLEGFSKNCFTTDMNGTKKKEFSSGQHFRVMIPKEDLKQDIAGKINLVASCNTKPIFYGEAPRGDIQNYAITYKPYADYEKTIAFNQKTNIACIEVIKKDEEDGRPLKGVVFKLYKENGEYVDTQTTNDSGIATFRKLYQGKYKIEEVKSHPDYIKNDTLFEINAVYNKTVNITISNKHKKGNLKITKVDKDDNEVFLDGIEFDLLDSNGKTIAHLITDKNGEAEVKNINTGNYILKETKTKPNYNLCTDENIEVKWDKTSEITIQNEKKKGQIKIIKQDKENSEIKLTGVEFQIIDSNHRIVDKVKTNDKGEAVSSKLPIGEYKVKEMSLGNNSQYILNEEIYQVEVEDEKIAEIIVENEHKKGNLKIIKVDKDDPDITLGAIEFDLLNEDKEIVAHLITNADGEAEIKNVNTGSYTLKETKTKREYNLCENENIIVEWNRTSQRVIANEKKKGQIKIVKEDADKASIKLEGVKFQILDKNDSVLEEVETNKEGEAISSRLPIGEYKIKEIDLGKNEKYVLSNEIHTIRIEDNQMTTVTIKNEHKKGDLQIHKVDKDNQKIPLKDVKFKIVDEDGFEYITATNKNGVANVKNIRTGKVAIKEIETNEEYVLSNETYELEIRHKETSFIIIQNEKKKGQVEVYKQDKEDHKIAIPEVEFEVLNGKREVVDKLVTDENGYAISKKLPIGEYWLKEIKTNRKYILTDELCKIEIKENEISKLQIENEKIKGKIQIMKISSKDSPILNIKKGDTLAGVLFDIYNESGTLVDSIVTDGSGQGLSKELEVGRYKIIEKNTSEYYLLNTNEFFINIERNKEIKTIQVENEPIIPLVHIEKTGQQIAEKNEEIKYEFDIQNKSNSALDNFTWKEYIPYDTTKVTKMVTGIYNEELNYTIYYKTNQNDYRLLKEANACESEYLSFDILNLEKNEVITEIKVEYKTVSKDFKSIIHPCIFTKVNDNVKKDEVVTNITELSGNIGDYTVQDRSTFETIIQEKEILKKLPKTGC